MNDLQHTLHELSKDLQLLHLATVDDDGHPCSRPVVGRADAELTFRFSTHLDSAKVGQMRRHPQVAVTLGANDTQARRWVQLEARAEVTTDAGERQAFWFDGLKAYFTGLDDPRYAVVILRPLRVRLCTMDRTVTPQVWTAPR
jgi:general stress protein 26